MHPAENDCCRPNPLSQFLTDHKKLAGSLELRGGGCEFYRARFPHDALENEQTDDDQATPLEAKSAEPLGSDLSQIPIPNLRYEPLSGAKSASIGLRTRNRIETLISLP
ncbi:hypothetical protein KOR42_13000 [Thalassoglobus neptunius]|uniref:Uncharacterized protein n=1 Tax=Thalassoglobus neptunius TaxID=1938619 RepID=A0A5C5X7J2_9PLAN|nr:hypothetical protein KOR42_13000 [Thalassoglobus neptunius]